MELGLHDRVALVTGASRGIGRQVAVDLAGEGCHVAVCARDEDALRAVATEIEGHGRRAAVIPIDLADAAAAALAVERCVTELGRVDILVNNAGGAAPKPLDRLTDDDWRAGFEVNFLAAARLAGACLPLMRAQAWGRMVHVASTYGREPDPLFAPYSAAKAALLNLSTSISRAHAADGVLSSCVIPGVTLTELVEANASTAASATGTTPEGVMAAVMAKDPVAAGRFGQPAEVSAAVLFLVSEQASWITGAALAVDGGTLRGA